MKISLTNIRSDLTELLRDFSSRDGNKKFLLMYEKVFLSTPCYFFAFILQQNEIFTSSMIFCVCPS